MPLPHCDGGCGVTYSVKYIERTEIKMCQTKIVLCVIRRNGGGFQWRTYGTFDLSSAPNQAWNVARNM